MNEPILVGLVGAATIGLLAVILILRRERHEAEDATRESPFAASTEGMKVCPRCSRGNLWTSATCLYCGAKLPG